MIAIISPAKNMKRNKERSVIKVLKEEISKPLGLKKTEILLSYLKEYNPFELETLMKINEPLAVQAFMDFQNIQMENEGTPALLTYDGLVYKNIEAEKFTKEELDFANSSLRILSAFYGILRPMDGIQPYRLEMQCKIKINGINLYKFWEHDLYTDLYKNGELIINLASEEYAKCIRKYVLEQDRFVDIEFLVMKQGKLKNIATWAKMARGQMVRYLITKQITDLDKLKEFNWMGYTFEPSLSYENKYVFVLR